MDYINAHATSTPLGNHFANVKNLCNDFKIFALNGKQKFDIFVYVAEISCSGDAAEANAIKHVFSDHATSGALSLSSTKVIIVGVFNQVRTVIRIEYNKTSQFSYEPKLKETSSLGNL